MGDSRDVLSVAFADLEATVAQHSRLAGLDAAYATVRRRRGRRVAFIAAALVVVVMVPVAAAVGWWRWDPSPDTRPAPAVSTSSVPTPTPSVAAAPSLRVLADLGVPERIRSAQLDVPDFGLAPCPSGLVQFRDGRWEADDAEHGVPGVSMWGMTVGDIDRDGVEDIVVILNCTSAPIHGNSRSQVVAYSGPRLDLLGTVATGSSALIIPRVVVASDGTVEVEKVEVEPFTPTSAIWRDTYRWAGDAFERVSSVDIPRDAQPADLVLDADPTSVELPASGASASIRLTVYNRGMKPSQPLTLHMDSAAPLTASIDGFRGPIARGYRPEGPPEYTYDWNLLIEAPESGQSVTTTLYVVLPAGTDLPDHATLQIIVMAHMNSLPPDLSNRTNDYAATVKLTLA